MQFASFKARCPAQVGDRVVVRETTPAGMSVTRERVVTDIAITHFVREGRIEFSYELDNSHKYVRLGIPGEVAASSREDCRGEHREEPYERG